MTSRTIIDHADRLHQENEKLRAENKEMRAHIEAVAQRCEANNWMGTARFARGGVK